MTLIDDLRKAAAQRPTYRPDLPSRGTGMAALSAQPTIQRRRVDPNDVIRLLNTPAQPVRLDGPTYSEKASAAAAGGSFNANGVFEPKGPSTASKIFSGIIKVVDAPRAALVSASAELGDLAQQIEDSTGFNLNNRVFNPLQFGDDGNFSLSDLSLSGNGFREKTDLGAFDNPVTGFVGDVAFDPTAYVGFGAVKRGLQPASLGALDNAVISGSRRGLAMEIASQAAQREIRGAPVEELIRQAGMRGRGALTAKGLERSGADRALLERLGMTTEFGYSVGKISGRGRGVTIKGTGRLAEGSENLKGSLKKAFGSSKGAEIFRRMFVGGSSAIGQAERKFVDELITGGADAATAARGLGVISAAKRDAYSWFDAQSTLLEKNFDELKRLTGDEATDLARRIELGELDDELAQRISQWYKDIGDQTRELGAEFGNLDNYVNHVLSKRARRELINGNPKLKALGLDATEAFQKTRGLRAGDDFMGVILENGSIDEINRLAKQKLGFELFESDIRDLMSAYMDQAMRARMRHQIYNFSGDFGLNAADEVGAAATVRALEAEGAELLKKSAKIRKDALKKAAKDATVAHREVAQQLSEIEARRDAVMQNLKRLEDTVQASSKEVDDARQLLDYWQAQLEQAKKVSGPKNAALKGKATRQIKNLEKQLTEAEAKKAEALARLGKANSKKEATALSQEAELLKQQVADLDAQVQTASAARAAMDDPSLPIPGTEMTDTEVVRALDRVEETRSTFVESNKEWTDASAAFVWQMADDETRLLRLNNARDRLEQIIKSKKGAGSAGASDLYARTRTLADSFDQLGLDESAQAVRAAEAQAIAHDIAANVKDVQGREIRDQIFGALDDEGFQKYMTELLEDNYRIINEKVAVPEWFDEAFASIPRTPEDWGRLRGALRLYDKALNVWKGWATTTPGFMFRNWYSGMFGMYLDGVDPNNVRKFSGFLRQYHESFSVTRGGRQLVGAEQRDFGLEAAQKWARNKNFSESEIANMTRALEAASASGWGLNPQEVATKLVGSKASWNPFNVEFGPTRTVRSGSTRIEAVMRGSHAYDVLQRGGSIEEAVRHVEKFHFNYRDITDFDRAVKRAIPFWTFFSRNMALQAQVWYRYPQKLNRTYFNLKRNLELQSEEDTVVPGHFEEMGAIRLPFGSKDGGRWYMTPDLPTLRFRDDLAKVTGLGGEGLDPVRFLTDTSPAIKTPVEMLLNKELFTDIPYKNRMYDYDAEGNMVPRKATDILQGEIPGTDIRVPVVGDLIRNAADIALGDTATQVNGQLLIQDNAESVVEDAFPLAGRLARLFPNNPKFEDRRGQSILSFLGASARQNTERSIRGELYARQKEAEAKLRAEQTQRMLEGITP